MGCRYVCFTVGNSRYGIPVDSVVQIISYDRVTDVPTAPPFVEGVLNLRGDVIPIINIRERFGLPRIEVTRKSRVIVISNQERNYGLLVDGVREIVELSKEAIEPEATSVFGMKADFVRGIARDQDKLILIPDIFKILATPADTSVIE